MAEPDRTDRETEARLLSLERLARRMDAALRIPGTRIRIGVDGILGLIPGIGDGLALAPAGYIIWQAHRLGAPPALLARMGVNTGIDVAIGSVPLIGDIFDVGWKSNLRNVDLLRRHIADRAPAAGEVNPARPGARDLPPADRQPREAPAAHEDPEDGRLSSHHPGIGGPAGIGRDRRR